MEVDPRYFRPTEVEHLVADPAKARTRLGWNPQVTFRDLVKIMVDCDLQLAGLQPKGEGMRVLAKLGMTWTNALVPVK